MTSKIFDWMREVVGEKADRIAEETAELEGKLEAEIPFKSEESPIAEQEAEANDGADESPAGVTDEGEKPAEEVVEEPVKEPVEQFVTMKQLALVLEKIEEIVRERDEAVEKLAKAMDSRMKAIERSEDEKIASVFGPLVDSALGRPTARKENIVEEDVVEAIVTEQEKKIVKPFGNDAIGNLLSVDPLLSRFGG